MTDAQSDPKELYKIIKQQDELIKKLTERVDALEKKEKEREDQKENQYFISKNSKIVENDREKDLALRKWIHPGRENFEFKLLFRMSRDGKQCSEYHKLCDNKDNLLTIIEASNGKKFGGFASKSWGVPDQFIEKTFMFSLDNMKKYERLNNNNSKHDGSKYGPVFGNAWDVFIDGNMMTGLEQINQDSVFFKKNELTEKGAFGVKEIEVFQIE